MLGWMLAGLATPGVGAPVAAPLPLGSTLATIPHPSVVVLWASWCVSCRAEVARLPSLVASAAPLPIVTLAIDAPATARRVLAERHLSNAAAFADGRDPRAVLDQWGGVGSALPIAVALGRNGQVCARKLGLLGTDQLKDWAARCSR